MSESKIPKIIHYCWFGRKEKPKDVQNYIQTWKRYLPDYKLMEWNEDNFIIKESIPYVREAYDSKKWAFVSDYVRLYALYHYGGIYFDTDVQVFQSFDSLLTADAFVGFESKDYLTTAVMAAGPNHWFINEFLEQYDNRHFLKADGSYNESTNVVALTKLMCNHGLKLNGERQTIEDIIVYPQSYFSDNSVLNIINKYRKGTFAYHHYNASWQSESLSNGLKKRIRHYVLVKARNIFGTATLYNLRHKE